MIRQEKKNSRKKWFQRFLCLFFLLAIVVTGYFVYHYYKDDKRQEDRFKELEKIEEERNETPVPQKSPTKMDNPDWIGWLQIKDTSISYPVMQRNGDNEYYLHRDFDGNYSFYGTPFLDARCTYDSDNCIIYGHNINGGRMFGALHAYADKTYYKEHSKVTFRIGDDTRLYKIVSVIQTTTDSPVYSFIDMGNWDEYLNNVKSILSHSLYQTEMGKKIDKEMNEKTQEDFFRHFQFLTLSTCRSWAGKDARLLVIAVRERQIIDSF